MKTLDITVAMSLYSCSIVSMCRSLTVNLQKVPQILSKLSDIDQLLFTMIYVRQIYKSAWLFLVKSVARFGVLCYKNTYMTHIYIYITS
jgi:hypothetical protein